MRNDSSNQRKSIHSLNSYLARIVDFTMETYILLAYLSFFGGIHIYIMWYRKFDHETAWGHARLYWILFLIAIAVGAFLKSLRRISVQLQELKEELSKQK